MQYERLTHTHTHIKQINGTPIYPFTHFLCILLDKVLFCETATLPPPPSPDHNSFVPPSAAVRLWTHLCYTYRHLKCMFIWVDVCLRFALFLQLIYWFYWVSGAFIAFICFVGSVRMQTRLISLKQQLTKLTWAELCSLKFSQLPCKVID